MAAIGPQLTSKRCYERCSKRIYRRCFIATRRDHLPCYCARGRAAAGCVILMLPQETSRKHGRRHVSFVCGVVLFAVTPISSARLLPHFRRFHQAPPRGTGPHPLLHIPPFVRFRFKQTKKGNQYKKLFLRNRIVLIRVIQTVVQFFVKFEVIWTVVQFSAVSNPRQMRIRSSDHASFALASLGGREGEPRG